MLLTIRLILQKEIDLKNAFHQVLLDKISSRLTRISTPFGLYRYNHLPMGIKQSPAIFKIFLEKIMCGINSVEIYQDNLYVHGPTKDVHDNRLKMVINRLKKHKLVINPENCKIGVKKSAFWEQSSGKIKRVQIQRKWKLFMVLKLKGMLVR